MALLDLHHSALPQEPVLALRCNPGFAQQVSCPSQRRDPALSCCQGTRSRLSLPNCPMGCALPFSEGQSGVLEPWWYPHHHGYLVQRCLCWLSHIMTAPTQTHCISLSLRILEDPGPPNIPRTQLEDSPLLPAQAVTSCHLPLKPVHPSSVMGAVNLLYFLFLQAKGAFQ